MYARKIAQIAESRRHLRRDCGSLTYRRPKRRSRKSAAKREITFSRRKPLFLVFLFFVTQYFFLKSSVFGFREVEIKGSERVADDVIESTLGLTGDTSYWDMSASSLEQNLTSLHGLEQATVAVVFPGRVEVQVSEREPDFYVAYRGKAKNWFSVDSKGKVIDGEKPPKGSLRFLLPHPVKDGIQVREKDLQVVRFFQDQLSEELAKRLQVVKISQKRHISLRVRVGKNRVWARLGRPERLQYKLFLLGELIRQLGRQKAEVKSIDLRYSAPVVKMKEKKSPKSS